MILQRFLDYIILVGLMCCLIYQNWKIQWVQLVAFVLVYAGLPMLLVVVTFPEGLLSLLEFGNEKE